MRVSKCSVEVAEDSEDEERRFRCVQELDDGDTERIRDEATAADADNHDGTAEKDGFANADAAHEDRHEAHHEEFEEDFDGVEHAVSLLTCLRRREEAREDSGTSAGQRPCRTSSS